MSGPPPPPPLATATGLGRRHGRLTVLGGVGFTLRPGERVALLGPNGAGKTTLLELLAGVARPSEGSLRWHPEGVRVGWVPHRPALYGRMSARENLRLFAALERDPDPAGAAETLLARADLLEVADRPAGKLSTGTRQRLNLAIALAGRPAALLLDEPTATLSPEQRVRLWDWLTALRDDDGLALVFATQSVHEAARHADRMVVVVDGRAVFEGDMDGLLAVHGPGEPVPDAAEAAYLRLVEGAV